jgi:hypothetical protein
MEQNRLRNAERWSGSVPSRMTGATMQDTYVINAENSGRNTHQWQGLLIEAGYAKFEVFMRIHLPFTHK